MGELMFWHSSNRGFLFALLGGFLRVAISSRSSQALRLNRTWRRFTAAGSEFENGDYARAASDLEGLSAKAEFAPTLEPVFFTLGSAWLWSGLESRAAEGS